ncbi:hypothetical protein ES692_17935 [Psychroserpens burtonensis]|uniref:DUF4595 domain-containing protein n=2 Tax=Psychroserpens burtonensis TaxID=49278 RepID=A0A5C7AXW4_9FLAO|nr:hypothetical protein ES692_17935 [Psychroserpens burtonensis]
MRKTTLFFALILLNTLIFSCSSDDSIESQEPEPTENKLVRTEQISENIKVEYDYNDEDLLSSATGTLPNLLWVADYTYNSEGWLIVRDFQETGASTFSDSYIFEYNPSGLLTSYSSNTENVNLVYNDNIVNLTGTIEGNSNSEVELELNNLGLVVKLTTSNYYTNFEYSSNGNITNAKSYDNTDNLLIEYTINYDNKINPFYGQLKSIYIERFIEFFLEYVQVFIGSSFEGYSFPFLKNNITSISRAGGGITTYNYTYDIENHPISVFEDTSGNTSSTNNIEYY